MFSFTVVYCYHGNKFNKNYQKTYPVELESLHLTKVQNPEEQEIPTKSVKYV